jgi:hypothetical protein
MAYARVNDTEAVIVIINNDTKPADAKFDVSMLRPIGTSAVLTDALGKLGDVTVINGAVSVKLPPRSAAILTKK